MATPIDDMIIDPTPLSTFYEFPLDFTDPTHWENFIDFDGNQGQVTDGQVIDGQTPFPDHRYNINPFGEFGIAQAPPVREQVDFPRFPVDDLPWDEDSDFNNAEENPGPKRSPTETCPPSNNLDGQTSEICEGGFTDSGRRRSGDVTARSEKRHRFSKAALALLRKFFDHKPYPTEEEKKDLTKTTGGTKKQISTWFGNTRRRVAPKSKVYPPGPVTISAANNTEQHGQSPLQRYLKTPPRDDPVPLAKIAASLVQHKKRIRAETDWKSSNSTQDVDSLDRSSSNCSEPPAFEGFYLGATSDRGYDSVSMSGISNRSSASNSSQVSHASWAGRRGRKRLKFEHGLDLPGKKPTVTYQCTWCCQSFNRQDSWKRHEESEHCPQYEFVCMLHGYSATDGMGVTCVFCASNDISEEHLGLHNVWECYQKPEAKRSFARLDALVQHIRLVHKVPLERRNRAVNLSDWRRALRSDDQAKWICGFCQRVFTDWNLRCRHVAQHFTDGQDMTSWFACHRIPIIDEDISEPVP